MNLNDFTIGIEIETTIPVTAPIAVGPHGQGYDIPQIAGWKADRDPSIRAAAGRQACEFVSPVYKGIDGLKQLVADIRTIKSFGATVNASCGLHIHVGFDKGNVDACTKLATLVSNFEKAIYASTGTKSRERGRWCGGLNRWSNAERAVQASRYDRYHVCNFGTAKPTVEFRAFSASLNPTKIVSYVRLCIALVERALTAKKVTQWTAVAPKESSPITRGGEGLTCLNRFFYQVGWTKGRQPYTFGNLIGEGLPSIDATKDVLVTLARKYDAQP